LKLDKREAKELYSFLDLQLTMADSSDDFSFHYDKLGDADRKKAEAYGKESAKPYMYKIAKYITFRNEEANRLYELAEAKVKKSYRWNITGGVANIGTSGGTSFGKVVNSGAANFGTETPKKRGRPQPDLLDEDEIPKAKKQAPVPEDSKSTTPVESSTPVATAAKKTVHFHPDSESFQTAPAYWHAAYGRMIQEGANTLSEAKTMASMMLETAAALAKANSKHVFRESLTLLDLRKQKQKSAERKSHLKKAVQDVVKFRTLSAQHAESRDTLLAQLVYSRVNEELMRTERDEAIFKLEGSRCREELLREENVGLHKSLWVRRRR
jgi:hypothetical protein